ncbi:MAG: LamG domain-containing protein, partial [Bacteroidetes bacterium]|nr:LamG domain-containing protein [Bacteroidota bacterium]
MKTKLMSKSIVGILLIAFCLMYSVFCSAQSLTTGLVGYWKLDESSGDAADCSGNNRTMTNEGSTPFASCLINNGGDLGTTAGSKYFGKTSETFGVTSLTNARSISMWVKLRTEAPTAAYPTGCYGINVWTTKINGGNAMSYGLDYGDGQIWGHTAGTKWLRAYQYGYNEYYAEYQIALGTTNWHHLVWTYAGNGTSNLKLYIDGSLVSQANPSDGGSGWGVYPTSNRGFIGMDNTNTPGYFDEVGFWSRALTAAEVTSLYNSGAGWQHPFIVATAPTVTTQAVSNITAITATGNGNVTSDGGATITERGVCWNTSSTPTTADNKATSAG